jgi:hypothetical protein
MIEPPAATSMALFKGGPTLIDLLVDVTELRITVTGPRMLFERLELVTTLSALDGCTVQRLRELADCLEGTIHCGLVGVQHAGVQVETLRSGGSLQIDLGPPNMYQSELVLRTRTGETFRGLVQRLLVSDPSRPFVAGLHAVTASGHLEHGHAGTPGHGGGHHSARAGGAEHGHP